MILLQYKCLVNLCNQYWLVQYLVICLQEGIVSLNSFEGSMWQTKDGKKKMLRYFCCSESNMGELISTDPCNWIIIVAISRDRKLFVPYIYYCWHKQSTRQLPLFKTLFWLYKWLFLIGLLLKTSAQKITKININKMDLQKYI